MNINKEYITYKLKTKYEFTDEIISEIYNYCNNVADDVNDEYVLSVAKSWHEHNIKTKNDLDNYIKKWNKIDCIANKIRKLIGRKTTEYEKYVIEEWYDNVIKEQ